MTKCLTFPYLLPSPHPSCSGSSHHFEASNSAVSSFISALATALWAAWHQCHGNGMPGGKRPPLKLEHGTSQAEECNGSKVKSQKIVRKSSDCFLGDRNSSSLPMACPPTPDCANVSQPAMVPGSSNIFQPALPLQRLTLRCGQFSVPLPGSPAVRFQSDWDQGTRTCEKRGKDRRPQT